MGCNTNQVHAAERTDVVGVIWVGLKLKSGTLKVRPYENRRVAMLKKERIELGPVERFYWTIVDHMKSVRLGEPSSAEKP